MTTITYVICSKCGRYEELSKARKAGWLIEQRLGRPGFMVIRCSDHVTNYARRQAGLSQCTLRKVTS